MNLPDLGIAQMAQLGCYLSDLQYLKIRCLFPPSHELKLKLVARLTASYHRFCFRKD